MWPRQSSDEKKLFDVQSNGTARSEACTAEARSPAKKCAWQPARPIVELGEYQIGAIRQATFGVELAVVLMIQAVPVTNLVGLTSEARSNAILLSYEGSLQLYLGDAGPVVPVASFVGS